MIFFEDVFNAHVVKLILLIKEETKMKRNFLCVSVVILLVGLIVGLSAPTMA